MLSSLKLRPSVRLMMLMSHNNSVNSGEVIPLRPSHLAQLGTRTSTDFVRVNFLLLRKTARTPGARHSAHTRRAGNKKRVNHKTA
jgi:hypothetical protein